jgi:hypothetical protein
MGNIAWLVRAAKGAWTGAKVGATGWAFAARLFFPAAATATTTTTVEAEQTVATIAQHINTLEDRLSVAHELGLPTPAPPEAPSPTGKLIDQGLANEAAKRREIDLANKSLRTALKNQPAPLVGDAERVAERSLIGETASIDASPAVEEADVAAVEEADVAAVEEADAEDAEPS